MSVSFVVTFVLIVIARIVDVSLDTVRTASIVQGRRVFAGVLGFFQATVYICVIGKVLENAAQPAYVVAFGLGFGLGTYFGIAVEQYLAFGRQMASLITRKGAELSAALTAAGYRVAHVHGRARDGEVTIVYVEVARKQARTLLHDASVVDGECFCILNDVRVARYADRAATPSRTPIEGSRSQATAF